ncbi:MAG: peptidoglycan DD-metalloendopeptidase family protein [Deltaproteobacteria bacterium]|nr:peptidoglycan DD-metalloendopeptidase family protein [Deltaproteobacteria bacterium]
MKRTCQIVLTVPLALLFSFPLLAESDNTQLKEGKKELQGIRIEIKEKKKGLATAGKKEKNLLTEIRGIAKKLDALEADERRLDREIITMEIGLREKTAVISDVRLETERKKNLLYKRLVFLYKSGNVSYLKFFFSADGATDAGRKYRYATRIAAHDRDMINEFRMDAATLSVQMDAIRADKVRLEGVERDLDKKRAEIKREKKERNRLLASVRKEKGRYKQSLKELKANARSLQDLLKKLERQAALALKEGGSNKGQGAPVSGFELQKGLLDFPVNGDVVGFFGKEIDKDSKTPVYRKGIEILAGTGSAIRAVYGGRVIFADQFKGYGLMVIIDHGGGFYTLYAHASRLMKKMNDEINKGDIIGEIGESGPTGEPVLYFEVRRGGKPENPMNWLKS